MQSAVESRVQKLELTKLFTATSTLAEIGDLYSIMNVAVLCSKSEGFPNVLLEAMASNVPVVAAAVGGVPELVTQGSTGRLVETRNAADFADTIDEVLDRDEDTRAMAARAAAHVRTHLTIEQMVDSHRRLYAELFEKASRKGP